MDRPSLRPSRLSAGLLDAAALGAAWVGVVELRGWLVSPALPPLPPELLLPLGWLVVPLSVAALALGGAYRTAGPGTPTGSSPVRLLRAVGLASLAVLLLLFLLRIPVNRSVLVGFAAVSVPALQLCRTVQHVLGRRAGAAEPHRVLVVGEGEARSALVAHLAGMPGLRVVGAVGADGVPDLAVHLATARADGVHVAGLLSAEALGEVARICDEAGLPLSVDANFLGLRTASVELQELDGWTALTFRAGSDTSGEQLAKRALDLVGSAAGLVLLAPLIALLAVGVRLHDGGPAFFRQQRVGRFGRPFTIHKLRTMVEGAELRPALGPKPRHDDRITSFGRVLRRLSLDELPQLWNVLRGDMSLVGPRPPLPAEVARYERRQWRRLSVRPGMTGLWQVSGRADLPVERWIELDLQYVDGWSLWLDLRLLVRTVPAVLQGTGAR